MAAGDYLNKITPEDEAELSAAFARLQEEYGQPIEDTDPSTPPEEESDDEDETGDDGTGGTEEESDDESDDGESESASDIDLGDGTKLSATEAKSLLDFKRFLDGNPDTRANLDAARSIPPPPPAQPVATLPAAVTPPTPPEGLDLDDPSVKVLWEAYQSVAANQQRIQQESLQRQQQENVAQVERAVSDWSTKYKVSETVLAGIRARAAASQVVPGLIASGKSTYDSIISALDQAFWSDPDLRSQYLAAAADDTKKAEAAARSKTRKLGSISGRGTTTGGNKPVRDMTPEERRTAMAAEIAEHMARS